MSQHTRAHWIQSPAWDGLWMFSGLWAPVLLGVGYLVATELIGVAAPPGWSLLGETQLLQLLIGLGVLHRMSTTYTVLATPLLREGVRQDPMRYVYMPAAILVGCLVLAQAFVFHSAFAFASDPRGQLWAFMVLAYVMMLWERWHFCMQEFGVLSIYRTRARQSSPADRRFDRIYAVTLMLGVNMTLFLCIPWGSDRPLILYGLDFDVDLHRATLDHIALGACLVGVGVLVAALIREYRHPQRSLPKLGFYLLVGSHTIILYFFPEALGLFFLSYIFHHWMVAIGLFNRISLNSYRSPSTWVAVRTYLLRVGPFFAGCFLFYLAYGPLNRAAQLAPVPDVDVFSGMGDAERIGIGVVTGLFFAFNYLHYYYDRCLYRFSDPLVRKNIGPLMFAAPQSGRGS